MLCRCYRAVQNEKMAEDLEKLLFVEEKELLSGHLHSLVFGDHDTAQVSFTHCMQTHETL